MELNIGSTLKLNNGVDIPIIGLGTWVLTGKRAYHAVLMALEAGYRLIDTAAMYDNERKIGEAIEDTDIPREEIFVTTKVWNNDHGYDKTLKAFEKSLRKLNLTYVDLYLIHWPATSLRNETWKALERIYKDEKVRSIGVSNFTIRHLNELFESSSTVPSVNQVEFSPFLYQKELMEFCQTNNIAVEAYCPLTRARKLDNPQLKSIGQKYEKTSAQVLLRWGIQHNVIQIPKSGSKDHIAENINIFDFRLDEEDMKELDKLNENFRIVDDPSM
ncbi:MAG: aldo/keto reductase [Candidatus Thorarchaeota archaeon]